MLKRISGVLMVSPDMPSSGHIHMRVENTGIGQMDQQMLAGLCQSLFCVVEIEIDERLCKGIDNR